MKILFLITSLTNGGAERAMSNITTHLPEGVEADILLNSISENDYLTDAGKISLGMTPEAARGLLYQLIAFFKRVPAVWRLKRTKQYDACISFMESANICNILTGNRHCKTIISVRNNIEQNKSWTYRYIVRFLIRAFYKKADAIATVSAGVNKSMIRYFKLNPQKITTITNGYDVRSIREQMKQHTGMVLSKEQGEFYYVTVGRMTYQKAHWHLIRAFSKVANRCDNARLVIIGQGKEKSYLETLIQEYGLQEKVVLIPFQKNPFVVLRQCDVYVMPSLFEGYCNALCEALICGLPCIATDFQSSAREILAPETLVDVINTDKIEYASCGILTPVCSGKKYKGAEGLENQEKLLADAMTEIYQNTEIYDKYKKAAAERGEQLDINIKVREWMALVQE